MTEAFTSIPLPKTRESRAIYWRETDPQAVATMLTTAKGMGITLLDAGFRSGGIMEPIGGSVVEENKKHFVNAGHKAVVLGKTEGSSDYNVVLHFPTKAEGDPRPDATFYAYNAHVGNYLRTHWNPDLGHNPLPGVVGHTELPDGRHATAIRFRRNYEMLGAEGFATGIHLMDTKRISPQEMKRLVRVLDATHVDSRAFQDWAAATRADIPKASWLHRDNPGFVFRGKEWWISPTGETDRMTELTQHTNAQRELYAAIDPNFDVPDAVSQMIRNNIELYPHRDGTVDKPELAADTVVIHGSMHPDNIHIRRFPDTGINFTFSGGDRAQSAGLRGQMIDWLTTATVNSPEHQNALISEFLKLHPGDKDKRGLAMHVMYRSILETSWFMKNGKPEEAKKLSKLTYDILKGNGLWHGVTTPLAA